MGNKIVTEKWKIFFASLGQKMGTALHFLKDIKWVEILIKVKQIY